MKRRAFRQLMSTAAFAQDAPARKVKRVTRLYPEAPKSDQIRIVPDILALDDRIIALRRNQPMIMASKPDGSALWEHPLTLTQFPTIAGVTGDSILVQTLASKLKRLNPQDGSFKAIKGGDSMMGRFFYAGDGYLIRPAGFQIELWKLSGDSLELVRTTSAQVPATATVDLVSPKLAAITAPDAAAMWTVELPSGRVHHFEPDAVGPTPLPMVTGADRERSRLLWSFTPRGIGQPSRIIAIDSEGNIEPVGTFERRGRFPIHAMKYGGELGIAHADGTIAWYLESS